MVTLAGVLGTLSGLRFVAPELEPAVTIATALAMHVTYAVICRAFAATRGWNSVAWGVAGLVGGIPTVAALVVLIARQGD
ncbi:MAG TPA: hypothetical protein VFD92_01365 [Candidatus Binatia bacterium]|nr:hypothetical protein [Candidatus Binatia bacterium]